MAERGAEVGRFGRREREANKITSSVQAYIWVRLGLGPEVVKALEVWGGYIPSPSTSHKLSSWYISFYYACGGRFTGRSFNRINVNLVKLDRETMMSDTNHPYLSGRQTARLTLILPTLRHRTTRNSDISYLISEVKQNSSSFDISGWLWKIKKTFSYNLFQEIISDCLEKFTVGIYNF